MCNQGHDDCHETGMLGQHTELYFAIFCGVLLIIGFLLETSMVNMGVVSLSLYIGSYFFGGYFTCKAAIREISKGRFEIDFLMLVAAIGAAFLNKWPEGALLLFLFSLGHALEHHAMGKARKSISALTDLAPKTAFLKKGKNTVEIPIEDIRKGDIIIVHPNSKIAADGYIIKGNGSIDQSSLTGESIPVDKKALPRNYGEIENEGQIPEEHRVFSGTINGNNVLEVLVTKVAADSTLSRLVQMVQEAQKQKSPTQLLTDRFQKYYVPLVILLVFVLNLAFLVIDESWEDSFYRSMAVLVAASPCALAISTPSAVLSGIARAARGGVLIKGGRPLEDLGTLTAIAFDKTGTLTEGRPKLTDVVPLGDTKEVDLLRIAVAVEAMSDHPLAKAVVRDGKKRLSHDDMLFAENLEAVQGRGVRAHVNGRKVTIGNLKLHTNDDGRISSSIKEQVAQLEHEGKTTMLVRKENDFIGILGLMDVPRATVKPTLERLARFGIRRMVMLTGDNQNVADAVAREIGSIEAKGSLLPEEKVAALRELMARESKIAMVGDGVNDAPAMAHSTVGIAMGAAGSDVALETADVALMGDRLEALPFAIGLGRKAKAIVRQNLWISLGMVAVLIPATIMNWATIGAAVIFHEGSTLLVVLNGLRLLAYKNES